MTLEVDYLPVATAGGANVDSQGDFVGSGYQLNGFVNGIAQPYQANKIWRQSSMFSAAHANLISAILNSNVIDDGNLPALITLLQNALSARAFCGTSAGSANAQTLSPQLIVTSYLPGMAFRFIAGSGNTAAATLNISTVGAIQLATQTAAGPVALVGGEIVAGNMYTVVYDGTYFQIMGSGTGSGGRPNSVTALTLGTDTAINTTPTALITHSITMPALGGPWRAMVRWNLNMEMTNTSSEWHGNAYILDTNGPLGTAQFGGLGTSGSNPFYTGCAGSDISAQYANGATILYQLVAGVSVLGGGGVTPTAKASAAIGGQVTSMTLTIIPG